MKKVSQGLRSDQVHQMGQICQTSKDWEFTIGFINMEVIVDLDSTEIYLHMSIKSIMLG